MKHFTNILLLLILLSCTNTGMQVPDFYPRSYFIEKFPGRPVDIAQKLGDSVLIEIAQPGEPILKEENGELVLRYDYIIDTINLRVIFNKESKITLFINSDNTDTIFTGYVSRYRTLYYLSEIKTDSTYWIGAMRIDSDTIQGLGLVKHQTLELEKYARKNLQSEIIQTSDTTNEVFSFKANKKLIRNVYLKLITDCPNLRILKRYSGN